MDNTYHDIEDFLTDESFRSWVKNPTPELDIQWNRWLKENPDKVLLVSTSREIIQNLKFQTFRADIGVQQRLLEDINEAAESGEAKSVFMNTWFKVAAMVIFAIGIGLFLRSNYFEPEQAEQLADLSDIVRKSNPVGVRTKLTLPDGSTIYLNSESTIEYPADFGSVVREVKLDGEAFFEVSKDINRPFKVSVDSIEVVVLGTQFNVNSDLSLTGVALLEGKVRLNSLSSDAWLELKPGQMATLNKDNVFTTTEFDAEYISGWKDGYLVFRDASFDEVVARLHKWYGVNVSVNNKDRSGDWSYTATFNNENLESVLRNMSTLREFDYVIERDSLIISF